MSLKNPETSLAPLPPWLSEADIAFYVREFTRTGFRGGLNRYRNWEPMAPFTGAVVKVPALYIAGERDAVLQFPGVKEIVANPKTCEPALRDTVMLPGCGHWTQQERPEEVNAAMISFLRNP